MTEAPKGKVLVVEDHEGIRQDLEDVLVQDGYEVIFARNREEADQLVEELAHVVVAAVVDGNLTRGNESGKDGKEVTKNLKSRNRQVLVIGYSSSEAGVMGVDENVQKGVNPIKILEILNTRSQH